MKALVIYCHPCPESFSAAIRDETMAALADKGWEARLLDLYAMGFDPVMSADARRAYHTPLDNEAGVEEHLAALRWADALIFIYPTWWYGQPAMLKGWIDRVWLPHAAFTMPSGAKPIGRVLTNIRHLVAISTLGSPKWWWWFMGAPGRRTLLTGLGVLCHPRCRTQWLALHRMDSASNHDRHSFLRRTRKLVERL